MKFNLKSLIVENKGNKILFVLGLLAAVGLMIIAPDMRGKLGGDLLADKYAVKYLILISINVLFLIAFIVVDRRTPNRVRFVLLLIILIIHVFGIITLSQKTTQSIVRLLMYILVSVPFIIIGTSLNYKFINPGRKIMTKGQGPKFFISYHREDSAYIAGALYDYLVSRIGQKNVYKDVDNIPIGADFKEHLDEAISHCDYVLMVMGKSWKAQVQSEQDWVRVEVESALNRRISVVPLFTDGIEMPNKKELPDSLHPLTMRNGMPLRPDKDFKKDIDLLLARLESP